MRRAGKVSTRLDFLVMPIGKYRGHPIRDLPGYASGYADWLLAQAWFRQRYPDEALALARAVKFWGDPERRQRIVDERRRAFEKRESERLAQLQQMEQDWLDPHVVQYDPPGIMPLGKYKNQPLAVVARDIVYCRWFKGSAYARMNPKLAADLGAMVETIATEKTTVMRSVEIRDGGCVVYRPAAWCRT
jgi:uncharacterized protein (DUF3820 family)